MDISNLKRDTATIEAGEWVDQIPNMGELRLRVRGIGSKLYTATLARITRAQPSDQRLRDRSLKPEAAVRVLGEAAHEALLLEWDGLTDKGKPVPYDKAVAHEWMTNPDFRPFLDAVMYAANVVENGRTETDGAIAKN